MSPRLAPVAAVAAGLVLFCLAAFDALKVVSEVRAGQASAAASARVVQAASALERALADAAREGRTRAQARADVAPLTRALHAAEHGDHADRHHNVALHEVGRQLAHGRPRAWLGDVLAVLLRFEAEEAAELERRRRDTEALTSQAIVRDGLGMLGGLVLALAGAARISRRRRAEAERRRRAERRDRAVHATTRALAEHETADEAAPQLLQTAAETYGWSVACGWAVDGPGGRLRLIGVWHEPSARLAQWRAACERARLGPGDGLPGEAWRTGVPTVEAERPTADGDERSVVARLVGLRSALCVPLVVEGETVGVLELLSTRTRPAEPELVEDLAEMLEVIAADVARRRARAETELAKRHFLALVSHELRTPLTSIVGYVQMLRGRLAGADRAAERSAEIIERNADRLHRLVDDLLLAAEVSRGRLTLEAGEVCLERVVRDAVDAAQPAAAARGIVVDVALEAAAPVAGDAGRLSQVLDNLLSNAIKFSHDGGRVRVAVCTAEERVVVEVRDEGIGVSEADLRHLSEQFFRARTARMAQVPGMGLGLSLARAIVEAHGGELRLASVEGEGTTVSVVLPATRRQPEALAA